MKVFKIKGISGFKAQRSELIMKPMGDLGKAENRPKVRVL